MLVKLIWSITTIWLEILDVGGWFTNCSALEHETNDSLDIDWCLNLKSAEIAVTASAANQQLTVNVGADAFGPSHHLVELYSS